MLAPVAPRFRDRLCAVAGITLLAAFLAAPSAAAAAQPLGSVPSVVADYAADPEGLLAQLEDLVGVGAGGNGLDFGEEAKVGKLNRVFVWTEALLAGDLEAAPVQRTNEWTAPILLSDKFVGMATIWINPQSEEPDLADFVQGASLGEAFDDIPAESFLVHDEATSSWFTLVGVGVSPVVQGSSAVSVPSSLAAFLASRDAAAPDAQIPDASVSQGTVNSVVTMSIAVLLIAALLIIPGRIARWRRSAAPAAAAPALDEDGQSPPKS